MSPRRNHPKRSQKRGANNDEERDISLSGEMIEEHSEGVYRVRRITGSTSTKPYRCPGCDQLIPTATPHTVAWLEEDVESRRHWHTACWTKRGDRKPRTLRSKGAPRY
ncbi:MAG: hypothetical protein F2709_04965 [Actinobacteria bacterium]|nr:hypothetical protein [Actinomycetota bacterium]